MSKKNKGQLSPEGEAAKPEETSEAYHIRWYDRIPFWVKAVFIKYWICGVVFFFINMGSGFMIFGEDGNAVTSISNISLLALVDGLVYGLVYYFFAGFLIELIENEEGEGRNFMIFYSRKWWAIWIDICYGLVWAFLVLLICAKLAVLLKGTGAQGMFQEPFSFALIGVAVDMSFVGIKDLFSHLYRKVSHKEAV
jgi:hypothetical protein